MGKKETQHIHVILSLSAQQMENYNWLCRMPVFFLKQMHGDLAFPASSVAYIIYLAFTFGMVVNKTFMHKPQAKICALIYLPNIPFLA